MANFPNSGRDIYAPQHLFSYDVRDLSNREMDRGWFGGRSNYEVIKADEDTEL